MGQDRKPPPGTPDLPEEAAAKRQSRIPGLSDLSLDELRALVRELQTDQIELARENEALRQAHLSLAAAHHQYCDFYDFAPVGF